MSQTHKEIVARNVAGDDPDLSLLCARMQKFKGWTHSGAILKLHASYIVCLSF